MAIINKMPQGSNKTISGDIALYNTTGAREGYLLCDGTQVLASDYPQFEKKLFDSVAFNGSTITTSLKGPSGNLRATGNENWIIIGGNTNSDGSYIDEGALIINNLTGESFIYNRYSGTSYTTSQDYIYPFYINGQFYLGYRGGILQSYDPSINKGIDITSHSFPNINSSALKEMIGCGKVNSGEYAFIKYKVSSTGYSYYSRDGINWSANTWRSGDYFFDEKNRKMFYGEVTKIYSFNPDSDVIEEVLTLEQNFTLAGIYDGMLVAVCNLPTTPLIKIYDSTTYEFICSFILPRESTSSSSHPFSKVYRGFVVTGSNWNGRYVYLVPIHKAREYQGIVNIKNHSDPIGISLWNAVEFPALPNSTNYAFFEIRDYSYSGAVDYTLMDINALQKTYVLPNINPSDGPYYGYIKT